MQATKKLIQEVGKAIADQRRRKGLTQIQVAEYLGVEKETVSRMETGVISPTLARLSQLSDLMDCPVGRFFPSQPSKAANLDDLMAMLPEGKQEKVVKLVEEILQLMESEA